MSYKIKDISVDTIVSPIFKTRNEAEQFIKNKAFYDNYEIIETVDYF